MLAAEKCAFVAALILSDDAQAWGDANDLAAWVVVTIEAVRDVITNLWELHHAEAVRGELTVVEWNVGKTGDFMQGGCSGGGLCKAGQFTGALGAVVVDLGAVLVMEFIQRRCAGVRRLAGDADDLGAFEENVFHESP